jgi:hypothetical protein
MMKYRSSTFLLLVTFLVVTILVFGFLLWIPLQIEQPISDGRAIPLSAEEPIGQTLLAHFSGLYRISIPAEGILEEDLEVIQFQLTRLVDSGEVISVRNDDVIATHGDDWIHFQFPPQKDTSEPRYVFYLTQQKPLALQIPAHHEDMYPEGNLVTGDGDLVFRAAFDPPWNEKINQLLARLSANKPGLLGSRAVYPLVLILMIASIVGLSWMLTFPLRQSDKEQTHSTIDHRDKELV